jgi:hypothetical protein
VVGRPWRACVFERQDVCDEKDAQGWKRRDKNAEKALAGVICESEFIRGVSLIQRLEAKPHRSGMERPAGCE